MTSRRPRTRSKFSPLALVWEHYATLRDYETGRVGLTDYLVYLGIPLLGVSIGWWTGAQANNVPEVLAASAIFTGLIFNVFVLLFDLTSKADSGTHSAHGQTAVDLVEQLRANVSYAVLVGIMLTGLLGIAAMFGDISRPLPPIPTLIVIFLGTQMLLTVFMILKRIRAIYVGFGKTQPERAP